MRDEQIFGELRSMLHRPPSREVWRELCLLAYLLEGDVFEERMLPYMLGAMERWPDELREAPRRWLYDLIRRQRHPFPQLRLVRHLRFEEFSTIREFGAAGAVARSQDLSHITHLSFETCWLRGLQPVRTLVEMPACAGLRALVVDNDGSGIYGLVPFLDEHPFEELRELGLRGLELRDGDLEALASAPWFDEIESLDLGGNPAPTGPSLSGDELNDEDLRRGRVLTRGRAAVYVAGSRGALRRVRFDTEWIEGEEFEQRTERAVRQWGELSSVSELR